jgi:alpha-galactosidase
MMKALGCAISVIFLLAGCNSNELTISHGDLTVEFNSLLHCKVSSSQKAARDLMRGFSPSESIETNVGRLDDFALKTISSQQIHDSTGSGKQWTLNGICTKDSYSVEKIVTVTTYDKFPSQAFFNVSYINLSERKLEVQSWSNHHYKLIPARDSVLFWSFQGESTGARKDWILPLKPGFSQRNFMGMNNTDYGGGIPVLDLWRPDGGIAIGHAEKTPKLVSLPIKIDDYDSLAEISITYQQPVGTTLLKNDTLKTIETFVTVHHGDFYNTLKQYSNVLRSKGIQFAKPEPQAFEASWCAWGYMRDFTIDEIRGTIQKLRALGIKWVTIDDGYQQAEGDWHVNPRKFPKGDNQMKALVEELHSNGFKVMLWWAPLAADPESKLLKSNPDLKLLTSDGAPQFITWWDSYYMSPSYEKTRAHTKEVLRLFLQEWNIDGLKMDGQHLNAVPPDHNPLHELKSPEQCFEQLPKFYEMIYLEAEQLKPGVVIQNCPCGTCMSVFNMAYMNQAVASDPLNSWQIRLKGKTYKALIGETAYFGDHVELSDNRNDFASSFGIGAVLGTKFTWPRENPTVTEKNLLTPEREVIWRKWFALYNSKMLSKAEYLGGLYDLGYDKPETHVIAKGDTLHFAFYNKNWQGDIKLTGLTSDKYRVRDYVNGIELGEVTRENPVMNFKFKNNLLIEVFPVR